MLIEALVDRKANSFSSMKKPEKAYFVRPDFFSVDKAINPHMAVGGSLQKVDHDRAASQWQDLVQVYKSLGISYEILAPVEGLTDMVFCANQVMPYWDAQSESLGFILSNMYDERRNLEVSHIKKALESLGYKKFHKVLGGCFEGTGDALWVPGRRLLCGGYGIRTQKESYQDVAGISGADIVLFELKDPRFYHLDTCLSILTDSCVLAVKRAFTRQGWESLHRLFDDVLEVPFEEADSPFFACNAHCPDGKNVILQKGSLKTNAMLLAAGFTVHEVDTSEFIKSGGSVFCMKMMHF